MHKLVAILLLTMITSAVAKNLGTQGQVYPIAEEDFRQFIQERLQHLQKTGEIKRYEREAQDRVAKEVYNPPTLPLGTIPDTKVYYVDPSVELTRPIRDNLGRILVKAGTVINPFRTVYLRSVLMFFNGNSSNQVAWVRNHYKQYPSVKFILTGGDIRKAAKLFGRIYYDQYGKITHKLHISNIPAIAEQDGLKWKVTVIGTKTL